MSLKFITAIVFSFMLTGMPAMAQDAQEPSGKQTTEFDTLTEQSRQALQDKNWVRLYVANRKLEKLRPWDPTYKINIARAAGMLERKNTAYHYIFTMQSQGLAYDMNQWPETEPVRNTEVYEYMTDMMMKAGEPSGDGEEAWTVDRLAAGFQALAWDATAERFLLGHSEGNEVLAVSAEGETSRLFYLPEEMKGVHALALGPGNTLWVASSELLQYDLASSELLQRIDLGGGTPGSLAVSAAGDVYAIDTAGVRLVTLKAGADTFSTVPISDLLVEPVVLALSADGSQLYLADHVKGLIMVDTLANLAYEMKGPETLNMGFITGMVHHDGNLLIVQSGFKPERVMRLTLDAIGASVEEVAPMATALPGFDGPAAAVIRGGDLVFLANAGTNDPRQKVLAMKTPLDAGSDIKPPDVHQFQEAIKQKMQEQNQQEQQQP